MDYYLEIKANSDTFNTKSLNYLGNESQCSSEGKNTTIEDHKTLVLHSLWILRSTTSHLTFDQAKQNQIFTRQITANTKVLLSRTFQ